MTSSVHQLLETLETRSADPSSPWRALGIVPSASIPEACEAYLSIKHTLITECLPTGPAIEVRIAAVIGRLRTALESHCDRSARGTSPPPINTRVKRKSGWIA